MTNLENRTYYDLLSTIDSSMRQRAFDSFGQDEAAEIIHKHKTIPEPRGIIISCDPEVTDIDVNTISDAVKFIVPRVIRYAERNRASSVEELIDIGHIAGLRHIYVNGEREPAIGFAFWKPDSFKLEPPIEWIPKHPRQAIRKSQSGSSELFVPIELKVV
jgi:hypothetical protein